MFYCCFWGYITPPLNLLDSVYSCCLLLYCELVNNVVMLFTRPDSSNLFLVVKQSLLINFTYSVALEASVLVAQAFTKKFILLYNCKGHCNITVRSGRSSSRFQPLMPLLGSSMLCLQQCRSVSFFVFLLFFHTLLHPIVIGPWSSSIQSIHLFFGRPVDDVC